MKIAPKSITVLTYQDAKWKLGADRQYQFDLIGDGTFEAAYAVLKNRLDQRFVSAIPDQVTSVLWEIPVKHLLPLWRRRGRDSGGSDEIVLQVGETGRIADVAV
ncbi:MAG: hypothetical protein WDO73_09755 [Ignavibacteriota bacterium]